MKWKTYPSYSPSNHEWLGEIPKHWTVDRLKWSIAENRNGIWGGEPDGINDMSCIRVADFDRIALKVVEDNLTLRSINDAERRGRLLKFGDLLLEKSGGGENQPVGVVVSYEFDAPAVCSNFIARVSVAKGYDSRFLTYLHSYLYSIRLNTRSIKQSTGIQNLDSEEYLNESAAYPPIGEQRLIATYLDRESNTIQSLIAKKERQIELLQKKRSALISHTVTKGLNPKAKMKDSGIEWLGEIPAHWTIENLRRVIDKFVDYRGRTPEKVDSGIPLITARNIKNGCIDLSCSQEFMNEYEYEEWMVRGWPDEGDVLITTEAPLGEVAQITDTRIALAQRIILLKVKKQRMTNDYLKYHFLSAFGQGELYSRATGSTAIGIKADRFKETLIAVPPIDEQKAIAIYIASAISTLEQPLKKIQESIDKLREYRTALISAAVTGKIDAREEVI